MISGDTIAAIASPPGRSARAVVRLSGPATREVLGAVLLGPVRPFDRGVFASAMMIGDPGGRLPLLVATFRGPRSYTGEDSAELLVPGHPLLAERVLGELLAFDGVRLAGPGEFTERAYLNDRLTLDRAEGVAAVIAAQSADELAAAKELLSGRTGALYRAWADELTTLLALVEAGIDFTDQEDVVAIEPRALGERIAALRSRIAAFTGAESGREAGSEQPRVVLAGAPNAGKSTLFNALLGRRRAVVSPVAGTTRDVLEEEWDLSLDAPGAGRVLLVDLAGVDEALVGGVDGAAKSRAREAIAGADVVVQCAPDGRFGVLVTPGTVIRVRTKGDVYGFAAGEGVRSWAGRADGLSVCALDGRNLGSLRRAVADAAWGARAPGVAGLLSRHRRALHDAVTALDGALPSIDPGARGLADPAVTASSLRAALDALGELVGRVSPDDVFGRIFLTFCIGK